MPEPNGRLKEVLDKLFEKYSRKRYLETDPVQFLHRYDDRRDAEAAGFIASAFAFGRVEKIIKTVGAILQVSGKSPCRFLRDFRRRRDGAAFKGFRYRFIKDKDLVDFLHRAGLILRKFGSFEECFLAGYARGKGVKEALGAFVRHVLDGEGRCAASGRAARFLTPSPENGSACKRLNLFLRWMVRSDEIDVGIWSRVSPSDLVVPVDTHMAKVSQWIGLTELTSIRWALAESITEGLRRFDPSDPVKYDFAITRPGIMGRCGSEARGCGGCELNVVCAGNRRR